MRILIDIGHPAHVHLFKNFAWRMQERGHKVLFTCREKEFEIELLEAYGFIYESFGKKFNTIAGKLRGLFVFDYKMLRTALRFKPDFFLSVGSMYAAQVSFLLGKPHLAMEDTGNMEQIRLYLPFTEIVFSPYEIPENLGKKQFRYKSYHELAYLIPKYFTPDPSIYKELNCKRDEKYAILRFISWNATHDVGQGGFTDSQKDEIVSYLSSRYILFISSESGVPEKYNKYLFKISPDRIHHAMAFADIIVSEGATMASEGGVLGTPSIYVNSLRRCYNEDQEKYGLVYNYQSGEGVLDKIKELETIKNRKEEFLIRRNKLLEDKIDITDFLIWYVSNYKESRSIIKNNHNYQNRFKI